MPDQPWYASFFGEDYLRVYRSHLTPERTEAEVRALLGLLALPAGSRVLDLACGQGRISIPLAALGYRVTGLDLSPVLLRYARRAARELGVDVRWVRGDMREIPYENEFAAVINIFTAFGYLENDAEDAKVLAQMQRALAPGGIFVLDTINRDGMLRRFLPADVERFEDGLIVLQEQAFDLAASRMNVHVTLLGPDGSRSEYGQSIRFYTVTELSAMFEAAGLQVTAVYGGLDAGPLTFDSRRLVVVGRKPG